LSSNDLSLGQALADIASVALVHERVTASKTALADQLQAALEGRVSIDRAKDLLMQRGAGDRLDSFAVLRKYARDHNLRVTLVAASVLSGAIEADSLIEYARTRGLG
jgi:AmiR/NasT family two-component response regulator